MAQQFHPIDSTMTFEKAMQELEMIVKALEESSFSLDDAVIMFERGTQLKKFCEGKLSQAKMKIDQISLDMNEKFNLVPQTDKFEE